MTTYGELFDQRDNEQKLDQLVELSTERRKREGELMDDLAKYNTGEPEMKDYLGLLRQRLAGGAKPVNQVRKTTVMGQGFYHVDNYSYTMYKWFVKRGFDLSLLTPQSMGILEESLTDKEKESFNAKMV